MYLRQIKTCLYLLRDLFKFSFAQASGTLGLMFVRNLTSGVGLLMILPLLQLLGLPLGPQTSQGLIQKFHACFDALHIPITLVSILCIYTVMVTFVAALHYAEQVIGSKLQQGYTRFLRANLHKQLLLTPWPFFLNRKISDLLYSLTGQVQGVAQCNYQLLNLLNTVFLGLVYTGLAFLLSWKMSLLAFLCAALLLGLLLPLHRLTSKAGHSFLQKNQEIFQALHEQFGALKMIKGSSLETQFMDKLVNINESLEYQNQRVTIMNARSRFLYTSGAVVVLSILLYIALRVIYLPLGSLLLQLIIFSRLLPMVSSAQQNYQRILHQLPSYLSIQELFLACSNELAKAAPSTTEEPIHFTSAIRLKNLCFAYPSKPELPIIQNINFTIPKNSTTAIIGPSGAGKSTLADLIIGLITPDTGEVLIDGVMLHKSQHVAWRKKIAYVTQEVFLFNASVRDNLTWFNDTYTDDALWHVLHIAAADFVKHLDAGLDTMLGDRGVRLSGGERQRIALARALLMKPELLILDESTNALDSENLKKIQAALKALHGSITILIISHQQEMCAFADLKLVLEKVVTKPKCTLDSLHHGIT